MLWIFIFHLYLLGFPDSSVGKESTCNAGDPGLILGSARLAREGIGYPLLYSCVSLVAQLVKNLLAIPGASGSIPGLGRSPGEGKGYPLQYSGPENSMDYIVLGIIESDRIEWLSLSLYHLHIVKGPLWWETIQNEI